MDPRCLCRLGYPAGAGLGPSGSRSCPWLYTRWRGQDSNLHWDAGSVELRLKFSLHSEPEPSRPGAVTQTDNRKPRGPTFCSSAVWPLASSRANLTAFCRPLHPLDEVVHTLGRERTRELHGLPIPYHHVLVVHLHLRRVLVRGLRLHVVARNLLRARRPAPTPWTSNPPRDQTTTSPTHPAPEASSQTCAGP